MSGDIMNGETRCDGAVGKTGCDDAVSQAACDGRVGVLYGVSVGPGDPGLMTIRALETIDRCPVIAAPETAREGHVALDIARQAADLSNKTVITIPVPMTRDSEALASSRARQASTIASFLDRGQDVALLTLGDVSIYSSFCYVAHILEERYDIVMIPGVPSFCAVAATLKMSLTEHDEPLHIIPGSTVSDEDALGLPGTKVFMKSGRQVHEVCDKIIAAGLTDQADLVCECGLPGQKIVRRIDEIPEDIGYLTTVIVKDASPTAADPGDRRAPASRRPIPQSETPDRRAYRGGMR